MRLVKFPGQRRPKPIVHLATNALMKPRFAHTYYINRNQNINKKKDDMHKTVASICVTCFGVAILILMQMNDMMSKEAVIIFGLSFIVAVLCINRFFNKNERLIIEILDGKRGALKEFIVGKPKK